MKKILLTLFIAGVIAPGVQAGVVKTTVQLPTELPAHQVSDQAKKVCIPAQK